MCVVRKLIINDNHQIDIITERNIPISCRNTRIIRSTATDTTDMSNPL